MGQRVATLDQQEAEDYALAEANAFMDEYTDYYRVPQNAEILTAELRAQNMPMTRGNLAAVYESLLGTGRLIPMPEQADGEVLPPAVAAPPSKPPSQPRSISTGLRSSDASAMRPAPVPKKPIVTRADLERMPRAEYNERLRDPAFRRAVDQLGTQ
jgi:hypothetical protein